MDTTTCEACHRPIGEGEIALVWEGKGLCDQCRAIAAHMGRVDASILVVDVPQTRSGHIRNSPSPLPVRSPTRVGRLFDVSNSKPIGWKKLSRAQMRGRGENRPITNWNRRCTRMDADKTSLPVERLIHRRGRQGTQSRPRTKFNGFFSATLRALRGLICILVAAKGRAKIFCDFSRPF